MVFLLVVVSRTLPDMSLSQQDIRGFVSHMLDEISAEPDPIHRLVLLKAWTKATDDLLHRAKRAASYELRVAGWTSQQVADEIGGDRGTISRWATEHAAEAGLAPLQGRFPPIHGIRPPLETLRPKHRGRPEAVGGGPTMRDGSTVAD